MIDIELVGLNMDLQKEYSLDEINYDIFYMCINVIRIVIKFLVEKEAENAIIKFTSDYMKFNLSRFKVCWST